MLFDWLIVGQVLNPACGEKLIKIGAKMVSHGHYITLQMAAIRKGADNRGGVRLDEKSTEFQRHHTGNRHSLPPTPTVVLESPCQASPHG